MIKTNDDTVTLNPAQFTDYSKVREMLYIRLVNPKFQSERLKGVPFTPFCDMAITYHILVQKTRTSVVSVRVTDEMFKGYGITIERLHEDALRNSPRLFPDRHEPVISILQNLPPELAWYGDSTLIFISNTDIVSGAAAICYDDVLKKIAEKVNANLYIIPSSTEECLALSEKSGVSLENVQKTLMKVNANMEDPSQQLSDHLYYYDRFSDTLSCLPRLS